MKNASVRVVFGSIALALGGMPAGASAAEIKGLATIALQSVMEDLAPRFEKASGHKERRHSGAQRGAEAGYFHTRRVEARAHRRQIRQLLQPGFRWGKRRSLRQGARAPGHRRRNEGQNQI